MKKLFIVLSLLAGSVHFCGAQTEASAFNANDLGIIPQPVSIKASGAVYTIPSSLVIKASQKDERNVAEFIRNFLGKYHIKAEISATAANAAIVLSNSKTIKHGDEAYKLKIGQKGILIEAQAGPGFFYGFQTLTQLFPADTGVSPVSIHQADILDYPRFVWRGMHLDVGRHFFSAEYVKRYIDYLASYKLNTFHWHLTEDQGWRIEIKKYPLLTQIGSVRKQTMIGRMYSETDSDMKFDGKASGGFYTQDQIKDVVAYAAKRYVTIVPEIEMPGHSVAVLAAYPELGCGAGPYDVRQIWGVSNEILCPSEATFTFLENVLTEVCQLFPSKYIHIGGDEAPKLVWKDNPTVLAIMKREHYTNPDQVQGWLDQRIEKFLATKGKKMVGWDEILEGGVSKSATIMSWRGEKGGIAAAKQGNDVVMTPGFALYFDHAQGTVDQEPLSIGGYLPMKNVYKYDPLPPSLTEEEQKRVLGAQANVWTEYIPTTDQLEYMIFPRMMALSELDWVPKASKDYPGFLSRTANHYPRLDADHIHYRIPEPEGLPFDDQGRMKDSVSSMAQIGLKLSTVVPGAVIKYTLDGSIPDENSKTYAADLQIPLGPQKTVVRAITLLKNGRKSTPAEESFVRKN